MKRTTIFLPEQLHEELRLEAFQTRISMAEVIRNRLQRPPGPATATDGDPILKAAGMFRDGTLTENLDEELYEL